MINTPSIEVEHAEAPRRQLVAAIIVIGNQFLMVHNIKKGLRIEPPGGKTHPEDNESPEEAVVRETMEELTLPIKIVRHFGTYQTETPEGPFDVETYLCEIDGEDIIPTIPEKEKGKLGAWRLYTLEELRETEELVPNMKEALNDLEKLIKHPMK